MLIQGQCLFEVGVCLKVGGDKELTTVLLKELTSFDLDYIRAAILIQGQSLLTSFSQTRGLFVGSV